MYVELFRIYCQVCYAYKKKYEYLKLIKKQTQLFEFIPI
jgi:hypothetical protein